MHLDVVKQLVRIFCRSNKFALHWTTHTAQNHVYREDVIIDWVKYVCRKNILTSSH